MHELSIATDIMEIVKENLPADGGGHVRSVKVRIGELAAVIPDSLEFCFDAITKGTSLEGAKLEIEKINIVAHCEACGTDSEIENLLFKCKECGGSEVKIVSGDELKVIELEVDD